MPSLVMTTMAGYQFLVPYAFSLRGLAERLPGGVTGMLAMAWLSGGPRARAVRDHWNFIPRKARREVAVEELCRRAGIETGELVGLVTRTAFDLGMDAVDAVMGMKRLATVNGRKWTCADMAALRKRLGLAARQFAQALGVGLRIVQAWDSGECNPGPQQRAIGELLYRYLKRRGARAFGQLLGEPRRYRKRGRPPFKGKARHIAITACRQPYPMNDVISRTPSLR